MDAHGGPDVGVYEGEGIDRIGRIGRPAGLTRPSGAAVVGAENDSGAAHRRPGVGVREGDPKEQFGRPAGLTGPSGATVAGAKNDSRLANYGPGVGVREGD